MRKYILGSIIGVAGFISLQAAAEVTMISADPADNSVVKSISKISTVWDLGGGWFEPDESVEVALKNSEGAAVATGYFEMDWDELGTFFVTLYPTVTDAGEYTLEIPNNIFDGVTNEVTTLHYTIKDDNGGGGGDEEEDPTPGISLASSTPEAGSELTSISSVETYWDTKYELTYDTAVKPYLVNSDNETVATGKFTQDWNRNGHFTITFTPSYTTPGEYTLVIPKNSFMDLDEYEVVEMDDDVTIPFTILAVPAPTTLSFERAYPATNSEVTSLSEIKLYWEAGEHTFTLKEGAAATIEDGEGTKNEFPIKEGEDNTQFIIEISPEIETEGLYTVTIPADIFLNEDEEEVTTEEIELKYNVKPVYYKEPFEADFDSADPANYSTLSSLSKIITYWTVNTTDVTLDEEAVAVVTDESEEQVTTGTLSLTEGTTLEVEVSLETEIKENGTYIVTIPANFLKDAEGDAVTSETLILSYTVDVQSGIISIESEQQKDAVIYTIEGRMVSGDAAPGIYIIKSSNGEVKKIMR